MAEQTDKPSDLDIRIGTVQQEFQQQLIIVSSRAANFAAELASCQAKLKAAEERIAALEPKPDTPPDLRAVDAA